MWFNLMSIRLKAAFGLVLLTLFILIIGGINYLALDRLQGNTQQFAGTLMPGLGVVINGDRDLYQALSAQQEYLLVQGKGEKAAAFKQDFNENVQQAKERMEKFIGMLAASVAVVIAQLGALADVARAVQPLDFIAHHAGEVLSVCAGRGVDGDVVVDRVAAGRAARLLRKRRAVVDARLQRG